MISKTDCLLLLFDLKEIGIDCTKQVKHLMTLNTPDIDTIKFINSHKELNVRKFYEKIRKSYNKHKSKLYINIVSENELNPKELLCCLASLQLQILLYNKQIEDVDFLKHMRFDEISKCLLTYYNTKDVVPCQKLLKIFKADLKLLEEIAQEDD